MGLLDIFLSIFDGYDVGDLGSFAFIIVSLAFSFFQSFRMLLKALKPRNSLWDFVIYGLPIFFYIMAAFIDFFLGLMLFNSYKSPLDLVQDAEILYGNQLHLEIIAVSLIAAIIMFIYPRITRAYTKESPGRTPLFVIADIIDISSISIIIGLACYSLSQTGMADLGMPQAVIAVYLFLVYTVILKVFLLIFNIFWTFVCAKTPSEDIGRGNNPLKRLLSISRRRNIKKALILFLSLGFCSWFTFFVYSLDTHVNILNGTETESDYRAYHNGYVQINNPDIQLLSKTHRFLDEQVYLLYASIDNKTKFFVVTNEEDCEALMGDEPVFLTGMLRPLGYPAWEAMERTARASGFGTYPTQRQLYFIDHTKQPEIWTDGFWAGAIALPFLAAFAPLFFAIFPRKTSAIKLLYRQYPDLNRIISYLCNAETGHKHGNAIFCYEHPITVTDRYIIRETPQKLEIYDLSIVASYEIIAQSIEIYTCNETSHFIFFPSGELLSVAQRVLENQGAREELRGG